MKKDNIQIGKTYEAKVSGNLVSVRVVANHSRGGFIAINLTTNRQIHLKTAARLRPIIDNQSLSSHKD